MKLACTVGGLSLVISAGAAHAGGLLLPGIGAISTSRAGASVASVWGPDSLGINPAGLASTPGTTVAVSSALIDYSLAFRRAGTYDVTPDPNVTLPWEGQPYPEVEDRSKPPVGLGPFQAVPTFGITSDLGGKIPKLHVGIGLWAPNAYPSRDIDDPQYSTPYQIDDPSRPPPPSRYDLMTQEAAVILPTIAAAYRVLPNLDIGLRFAWGIADVKARVFLWGQPQNFEEYTGNESAFVFEGKDHFVPNYALGVRYRPLPNLELGGIWSSQLDVHAKGIGIPGPSPNLNVGGSPVTIGPIDDSIAECEKGGVMGRLKACSNFAIPMLAKIGARWIFRDADGLERGDVEFDIDWEHWSAERVTTYEIIVDGQALIGGVPSLPLNRTYLRHGWKDTFSFRLGGGYGFPVGPGALIARGGMSYDTVTAKTGWERLDVDGAAKLMFAAGAGYKMKRWEVDVGGGYIHEGTRNFDRGCNPVILGPPVNGPSGCSGTGEANIPDRIGPDPANPAATPNNQNENPINQGRYRSHYVVLALGFSTWF